MTHTRMTRPRFALRYALVSVVATCVLMYIAQFIQEVVFEMLRLVILLFVTALACSVIYYAYWLVRPKHKPLVEANQKLTLDEMGITLEQASDQYFDKGPLFRLRSIHQLEHRVWDTEYFRLQERKRQ